MARRPRTHATPLRLALLAGAVASGGCGLDLAGPGGGASTQGTRAVHVEGTVVSAETGEPLTGVWVGITYLSCAFLSCGYAERFAADSTGAGGSYEVHLVADSLFRTTVPCADGALDLVVTTRPPPIRWADWWANIQRGVVACTDTLQVLDLRWHPDDDRFELVP